MSQTIIRTARYELFKGQFGPSIESDEMVMNLETLIATHGAGNCFWPVIDSKGTRVAAHPIGSRAGLQVVTIYFRCLEHQIELLRGEIVGALPKAA
jgi:hypothetical protein